MLAAPVRVKLYGEPGPEFALRVRRSGLPDRAPGRCLYVHDFVRAQAKTLAHVDTQTALCVIVNRYLLTKAGTPPDFRSGFRAATREAKERLTAMLPRVRRMALSDVPKFYSASKRKRAENALLNLRMGRTGDFDLVRSFVKAEYVDEGKLPHLISPDSPEYCLLLASYLKRSEKPLFRTINKLGEQFGVNRLLVSGMNVVARATCLRESWERFERPCYLSFDGIKRDKNTCPESLRVEFEVYCSMFCSREARKLRRLLDRQIERRHVCRLRNGDRISYKTVGRRTSGSQNTGSGTKLLMCLVLLQALIANPKLRFAPHDEGDDVVVFCDVRDREAVRTAVIAAFDAARVPIEVEGEGQCFEQLVFCKQQPVFDGQYWRMMPSFQRALERMTLCKQYRSGKDGIRWKDAVAWGMHRRTTGLPVFPIVAQAMGDTGTIPEEKWWSYDWRTKLSGLPHFPDRITDTARASFFMATGITPEEQRSLEAKYSRLRVEDYRKRPPHPLGPAELLYI